MSEMRFGCLVGTSMLCLLPTLSKPSVSLELATDLGLCVCDLREGICDVNCCCDEDCTNLGNVIDSFDCLPAGPANRSVHMCYSKNWVHSVNPRVDLSVLSDDLRGLLCVAVDNNPVEGIFYKNTAEVEVSRIDDILQELRPTSFKPPALVSRKQETRSYRMGDVLKVHFSLSAGAVLAPLGAKPWLPPGEEAVTSLRLPSPGVFGGCVPEGAGEEVRFLVDTPRRGCWLGPVDLRAVCGTSLNQSVRHSWVLRGEHLVEGGKCLRDRCIVVLPQVRRSSRFVESEGDCACHDALIETHYSFFYAQVSNEKGVSITNGSVEVVFQNLTSAGCRPIRVKQVASVKYLPAQGVGKLRSGNPGYIVGRPLLVAPCGEYNLAKCTSMDTKLTSYSFAEMYGIQADGSCSTSDSRDQTSRGIYINFGEDALFGCSLMLTRAQLASKCDSLRVAGKGFAEYIDLLRFGRTGNWTHIAAFGNANLKNIEDWIPVVERREAEGVSFDTGSASAASLSTCSGVVLGLDFEILYSPFGDAANPQMKIVAARAVQRRGALRFSQMDVSSSQSFHFTVTVQFLQLNDWSAVEAHIAPRPQLPLRLPHELWYPFSVSSDSTWSLDKWSSFVLTIVTLLTLQF